MNARSVLLCLGIATFPTVMAQWTTPYRLELTGADTADRQVQGLDLPLDSTAGVSVEAARTLSTNLGAALGTNALLIQLVPAPVAYAPGLRVVLVPSDTNTASVTVDINGLGPTAVFKYVDQPLDSGDLRPGIPVMLVHDGNAFQVTSQMPRSCPRGTRAFNADACIELTPRSGMSWYQANTACADRNGRLCTMWEWAAACLTSPSILPSVLAWEWVDSAANNASDAKLIGYDSGTSTPSCLKGAWAPPTDNRPYRCCYDR